MTQNEGIENLTGKLLVLAMSLLLLSLGAAAEDVSLKITSPARNDMPVGKGVTVKGVADIPAGHHVWVFARRSDFSVQEYWWPQGEGRLNPRTGEWEVYAHLGVERDVNFTFDIAAAIFDEDTHRKLQAYLDEGARTGHYPPQKMPLAVAPPKIIKVLKVSHQ